MATAIPPDLAVREEAEARAYLAGALAGFPIPITQWTGQDDGTAVYETTTGTVLVHDPAAAGFTAHIPCHHHTHHTVQVTGHDEYTAAHDVASRCSEQRNLDPLAVYLRDLAAQHVEGYGAHVAELYARLFAEASPARPVTVIPGVVLHTVHHTGHSEEIDA